MELLPLIMMSVMLLVAVWSDQRTHRIPNLLMLLMLMSGLSLRYFLEGSAGLVNSLIGVGAGFLTLIVPYVRGGMAAGDVKLLAAVGAFVGPVIVVMAGLIATVIGASVGGVLLALHRYRNNNASIEQMLTTKFPFAASIALGTASALILRGLA